MTEEDMERADYLKDEIRDEKAIAFFETRNKLQKQIIEAKIEEAEYNLSMLKLHGNGRNRGYALSRLGELRRQLENI